MHRLIQDHLEEVLAGTLPAGHQAQKHLKDCSGCRDEVEGMQLSNELLRSWRTGSSEVEPLPGFYARVLERIEAQHPISIWTLFMDSLVGRYLVTASLVMAVLTVGFAVSSEQADPHFAARTDAVEMDPLYPEAGFTNEMTATNALNNETVLMSLVSYQGR